MDTGGAPVGLYLALGDGQIDGPRGECGPLVTVSDG